MQSTEKIIFIDELTSTNDYLKQNFNELANNTFVYTNFQTKGRGQFIRNWESLKGENILMSWLIKTNVNSLTIKKLISNTIINFLKEYNIKATFKYPNDIYVNDKKIAGILIETKGSINIRQYLIAGIGINVNQNSFSEEKAISMFNITNEKYEINDLINNLIRLLLK